MPSEGVYSLSYSFAPSKQPARSLCVALDLNTNSRWLVAGDYAGAVRCWLIGDNDVIREASFVTLSSHGNKPAYSLSGTTDGGVWSGGGDGVAQFRSFPGFQKPGTQLSDHDKAVSSVKCVNGKWLVTGGWDGCLKIYEILQDKPQLRLSDSSFKYAVSVCGHGDYQICGSQVGELCLFHNAKQICRVDGAHPDIVRRIRVLPLGESGLLLVLSCSNWGDIKMWSVDTRLAELSKLVPVSFDNEFWIAHGDCFLFDFWAQVNLERKIIEVFTAPDNGRSLRLEGCINVKEGSVVTVVGVMITTVMQHPTTVWNIEGFAAADGKHTVVATACDDGVLRFFSNDETKHMPAEKLEAINQEIKKKLNSSKQENLDLAKLPKVEDMETVKGTRAGQTKLFVSTDPTTGVQTVGVYSWNTVSWLKIGDMIGGNTGDEGQDSVRSSSNLYAGDDFFPGGTYDYVFAVEKENGERSMLPYNIQQDPRVVAEQYCCRENLKGNSLIQQIVDFIKTNAKVQPVQTTARSQNQVEVPGENGVPCELCNQVPIIFSANSPWATVAEKLKLLNASQKESLQMTPPEHSYLNALVPKLESPTFNATTEISSNEFQFLFQTDDNFHSWVKWEPSAQLFPVFDIWRRVAMHQIYPEFMKNHGTLATNFKFCLTEVLRKHDMWGNNCQMMLCRYLANALQYSTIREWTWNVLESVLDDLSQVSLDLTKKQTVSAFVCLLYNLALGISEVTSTCRQAQKSRGFQNKKIMAEFLTMTFSKIPVDMIPQEIALSAIGLSISRELLPEARLSQNCCTSLEKMLSIYDDVAVPIKQYIKTNLII